MYSARMPMLKNLYCLKALLKENKTKKRCPASGATHLRGARKQGGPNQNETVWSTADFLFGFSSVFHPYCCRLATNLQLPMVRR